MIILMMPTSILKNRGTVFNLKCLVIVFLNGNKPAKKLTVLLSESVRYYIYTDAVICCACDNSEF